MNTDSNPMYQWEEVNWLKAERLTYKLQKRIYKASYRGDVRTVRRLQKLVTKSWYAKLLSVRRVTQDNTGKSTAGIDGIKSLSPKKRILLVNKLKLGTKVSPTRRVWIPKPGKDEKRPLGIPTMKDRALQRLVKLAIEPEWEAKFEPNSHGFRPARSCHDAIESIFRAICMKPKYVLDADISKCFDKINHQKLLEKLNTYPTLRKQIRAWLKAGVMDGNKLFPTTKGSPQGGVISPLLANIALHGMENAIKDIAGTFDMKRANGIHQASITEKRKSVNIIRYADDFVILHKDIEVITKCKQVIKEWLKDIGLELNPSKTRIAHTLKEYNGEKKGFNFLGFYIYQFKAGKCRSGKYSNGKKLGFKTCVTPSKESVVKHYRKLAEVINKHRGVSQEILISQLNPIIIGWCNYFRPYQCKKQFSKVRYLLWWKLWKWGTYRHPNKGAKWLNNRYWNSIKGDNWVFSSKHENGLFDLIRHTNIKTNIGYTKVKGETSIFDGNFTYWSTRMGKHPQMPKRTASLLKKQKGKCTHCELFFQQEDVIETDHILPIAAGGKDEYKNLQLLHRHCHDKKTKSDLKLIKNYQRAKGMDELYKWFNKLDWIWNEDIPTTI